MRSHLFRWACQLVVRPANDKENHQLNNDTCKQIADLIAHKMDLKVMEDYDLEEESPSLSFHCERFDRAYKSYLDPGPVPVETTGPFTEITIQHAYVPHQNIPTNNVLHGNCK